MVELAQPGASKMVIFDRVLLFSFLHHYLCAANFTIPEKSDTNKSV